MNSDDLLPSAVPSGREPLSSPYGGRAGGGGAVDHRSSRGGSSQNISDTERWASAGAGGLLLIVGLLRGRASGWLAAGTGAALLYRGLTGHCSCYEALGIDNSDRKLGTAVPAGRGFKIEKTLMINRSPEDLYGFWRDVENLPQVMRHLKRVDAIDARRSHWVAEGPLGSNVQWDAEIFNERGGEMIAWRSLPGGDIDTAGSVHFESLGDGRRTAVTVSLKYNPPAGKVGAQISSLLGSDAEQQMAEDLENLKHKMESESHRTPTTTRLPGEDGSHNEPG